MKWKHNKLDNNIDLNLIRQVYSNSKRKALTVLLIIWFSVHDWKNPCRKHPSETDEMTTVLPIITFLQFYIFFSDSYLIDSVFTDFVANPYALVAFTDWIATQNRKVLRLSVWLNVSDLKKNRLNGIMKLSLINLAESIVIVLRHAVNANSPQLGIPHPGRCLTFRSLYTKRQLAEVLTLLHVFLSRMHWQSTREKYTRA